MKTVDTFFKSKDHYQETPYSLDFHLCDEIRCTICLKLVRLIRTSMTLDRISRKEMLRCIDRPVIIHTKKYHYYSPEEGTKSIDHKKVNLKKVLNPSS